MAIRCGCRLGFTEERREGNVGSCVFDQRSSFKLRVVADAAAYGRGWRKPRACPAYVFVARDRGTEADFALD